MGICEVLIPLTASPSIEVQGNSAAAIGNLSSKGVFRMSFSEASLTLIIADDYTAFNQVWKEPADGLHGYLVRFLESHDTTFQHIAVWTIVQLLESGDAKLEAAIRGSSDIVPLVTKLSTVAGGPGSNAASSVAGDGPRPSDSASQRTGSDEEDDEADGEIAILSRKILDLLDSADDSQGR
jgi:hypothetical protein